MSHICSHVALYCKIPQQIVHNHTLSAWKNPLTNQYLAVHSSENISVPTTITNIVHKDILLTKQQFSSVKIRVAWQQWALTLEADTTPMIPDAELSLCIRLQQLNNVVFVVVVADVCLQMYTTQRLHQTTAFTNQWIKADWPLTRDTLNAPWLLTNRQFQWTGNGHS